MPPPPHEGDESPSSSAHSDEEYENPGRRFFLDAWHSDIPQIWIRILRTCSLHAGNVIKCPWTGASVLNRPEYINDPWLRFEIRQSCSFFSPSRPGSRDFVVDGIDYAPGDLCQQVFHHTKINNLVEGSSESPGSQGILKQGLCFGTCTHVGCSGVNFYSVAGGYGFWSYRGDRGEWLPGWVGLELGVNASTKLKGGSIGRYCITRANLGENERRIEVCPFAGIRAIWVPYPEAPDFLKA